MGILLLHGDNLVASRQVLQQHIDQGTNTQRIIVTGMSAAQLQNELGTPSLFDQPKLIILEELTSLGTKMASLLSLLMDLAATHSILIWEKKSLTKKALEPFTKLTPPATITEFKPSPAVFTWLDSFTPRTPKPKHVQLLQAALENSEDGLCFAMLQRQVRLLLEVKGGGQPAGPPFVIKKTTNLARDFSLDQLLHIHHRLLEIDIRQKTSSDYLTLRQELAQLVIAL